MADYMETEVVGKSWRRCHRAICENPLGGNPSINYAQQDIMMIGDNSHLTKDAPMLVAVLQPNSLGTTFTYTDPATGNTLNATEAQMFAMLGGHYLATALKKGAPQAAAKEQLNTPQESYPVGGTITKEDTAKEPPPILEVPAIPSTDTSSGTTTP